MKRITFIDRKAMPGRIQIGVELDNGVEAVQFELPEIDPEQAATLYWRNGNHADVVALDGGIWTIANSITQYPGEAECYIEIAAHEDILWHSALFHVVVRDLPGIDAAVEQVYPTAIEQALGDMRQTIAEFRAAEEDVLAEMDDMRDDYAGAEAERVQAENARALRFEGAMNSFTFNINENMELEAIMPWRQ